MKGSERSEPASGLVARLCTLVLVLDKRKATILRAVVRDYVRTGQPIGSKVLAQKHRLSVSPATVRNDMALLEELGYIRQPHTSAGRVPTDVGYRWFVDNWPAPSWPVLPRRDRQAIDVIWRSDFWGIDEALDSTSHVLSELTEATAVIAAPISRKDRLRRIELLRRDDRRATVLLIADTGVVEQGVVEFPEARSEEQLCDIAEVLSARLAGVTFEELPTKTCELEASDVDACRIGEEIGHVLARRARDRIFRGGTANILSPDKFSDPAVALQVIHALEQPAVLSRLLEATREAATVLVFIGQEVPVEQMRACSAIFASYDAGAGRRGTLGVVGPTRMDYPHTISAVEAVARTLSTLLDSVA